MPPEMSTHNLSLWWIYFGRRARIIPNKHGSAEAACNVWLSGSLFGQPIRLSDQKIDVDGYYRRNHMPILVQFRERHITVMRSLFSRPRV